MSKRDEKFGKAGGQLGGMTRDLFTEGLQIPFVKIFKQGKQDEEITAIIRSNVRMRGDGAARDVDDTATTSRCAQMTGAGPR